MTTVLVVDDSAVDRRLVGGLLEEGASVDVTFANDGGDALNIISRSPPDIVVTDLHMPGINGVELVRTIHCEHSRIPVVLITGQGSEELAVTALKSGAASYVPKTKLARDLLPTVLNVLSLAREGQSHEMMQSCWKESRCVFELTNDYRLIAPLVNMLRQMIAAMQVCDDTERVQLGVALEAALSNALYHGNLELSESELESMEYDLFGADAPNIVEQRKATPPYRDRRIHVEALITRAEVRLTIRDDGPGFDYASVPEPNQLVASEEGQARGITHMRLLVDEVVFNEKGNEVTLIKRSQREAAA
jgi:CheY-like chemotaxis protein